MLHFIQVYFKNDNCWIVESNTNGKLERQLYFLINENESQCSTNLRYNEFKNKLVLKYASCII